MSYEDSRYSGRDRRDRDRDRDREDRDRHRMRDSSRHLSSQRDESRNKPPAYVNLQQSMSGDSSGARSESLLPAE